MKGHSYASIEASSSARSATYESEGRLLVASELVVVILSRAWELALSLALVGAWGGRTSLTAPAALALVQTMSKTCLSPSVGRRADTIDRLRAIRIARCAVTVGTACSAVGVVGMSRYEREAPGSRRCLGLVLLGAAMEALGGVVARAAPKKDWAPAMFGGDDESEELAAATVAMSNAAQIGEICGPLLGAAAISAYGPPTGAAIAGAAAACLQIPAHLALETLYVRVESLRVMPPRWAEPADTRNAWRRCFEQPSGTALLTMSFACLHFTALAPEGSVLVAFLATKRVSPGLIALFRSCSALAGLAGIYMANAFTATSLARSRAGAASDPESAAGTPSGVGEPRVGDVCDDECEGDPAGTRTGQRVLALTAASAGALVFQLLSAAAATAALYFLACTRSPFSTPVDLLAFMVGVVVSRLCHHAFDVGYLQLQQTLVDERDRGASVAPALVSNLQSLETTPGLRVTAASRDPRAHPRSPGRSDDCTK